MLSTNAAPMCSEVMTVQSAASKTYTWDDFNGIINFLYVSTATNTQIGDGSNLTGQWDKIVIVSTPYSNIQVMRPVVVKPNRSITFTYMVPNNSYLLIRYGSAPTVIGIGPNVTRTTD